MRLTEALSREEMVINSYVRFTTKRCDSTKKTLLIKAERLFAGHPSMLTCYTTLIRQANEQLSLVVGLCA